MAVEDMLFVYVTNLRSRKALDLQQLDIENDGCIFRVKHIRKLIISFENIDY